MLPNRGIEPNYLQNSYILEAIGLLWESGKLSTDFCLCAGGRSICLQVEVLNRRYLGFHQNFAISRFRNTRRLTELRFLILKVYQLDVLSAYVSLSGNGCLLRIIDDRYLCLGSGGSEIIIIARSMSTVFHFILWKPKSASVILRSATNSGSV